MVNNLIKYLLPIICILSILGCKSSKIDILDYYKIYRYSELNTITLEPTNDKYVLMCKLGGKNDPYVPYVSQIEYNDKYMILNTKNGFYFIDGKGTKLCCMCNNITKGPFKENEIEVIKDSITFQITKLIDVKKRMN